MSDLSFRRVARTGLTPLMEDVPDGPEWTDLTPETTLTPSRSARYGWLAGVGAAVLVLVLIGVTALLMGEDPVPPPATETTRPASPTVFQPPTRTVDGETLLDLTLLDGSQIALGYPADLDLTSKGVEAQAAGGVGALNRTVITRYGPTEDFIAQNEASQGSGELTNTYTGPDGSRVERWDFPDIPYLVFDFSPWTAYVWDTKFQVGEVAEGWANNLHGTTDANGFLVLTADPPLELVDAADDSGPDGPDIRVEGGSGGLLIFINDCDRMTRLDEEAYGNEGFAFCDEPTNTLFFIFGDAEVQERIHKSLRVNPNAEPSTTTSATTTTTTTLAAQVPADGPIFGEETGMVLLLDDGLEGLTAIDPDARRAARSSVTGQRPGDEEFSMVRVGERLVVGWANIHAVDIATRQGLSLGSATVFVPSATEDNVWMIDYPGGSIGSGRPTVWQVNTSGETTIEPRELNSDLVVLTGIDRGLALQSNQGIELWNVATGEIRKLAGDGGGFAHDVSGDTLAWCSGGCATLNLSNTSSLTTEELSAPAGMVFLDSGFSDDGRYLAAILADDSSFLGEAILLLDRETGMETTISDQGGPVDFVAWAPDNDQLFATGYSYGQGVTPVWRYEISSGRFSSVVLPIGGALTPVVIDRSVADEYFTSDGEDF